VKKRKSVPYRDVLSENHIGSSVSERLASGGCESGECARDIPSRPQYSRHISAAPVDEINMSPPTAEGEEVGREGCLGRRIIRRTG